ncbi:BUD13 [Trichostrongylus colubriformis]|uniref:BUD13 homolog n=1 Tax=Trichostrongylus colubriformis TaxID=6319 RepID=A0AAN8J2U2_TRICO
MFSERRRNDSDSDQSPPRRHDRSRMRTKGSDSDQSPPRKHGKPSSHKREWEQHRERRISTPERLGKESQRTLDGKRAEQLDEMARVAAEPLARMADDAEMNRHLKEQILEEDPMAVMLNTKKRKQALNRGDLVYPTYQGECPPNRFGIRPGYRWDGVDRSNGFEGRLAQAKNKKNAQEREYYQNLQCYE